MHPINSFTEIISLSKSQPPINANTDSRLINIAAWDGCASFCATTCKVYPIPTESKPAYKIEGSAELIPAKVNDSYRREVMKFKTEHITNWKKAR